MKEKAPLPNLKPIRKTGANHFDVVFTCTEGQGETMRQFLSTYGLDVETYNGFPAFREKNAGQARAALKMVFDNRNRLPGWWNLRTQMLEEGSCTQEEFESALDEMHTAQFDKSA